MNRLLVSATIVCTLACATLARPVFHITNFGARVSDYLQTVPIQKAIDAAAQAGGGEVLIPEGVFRTGGLLLKSGVTLRLAEGAVLEGSRDPNDYPDFDATRRWYHGLVVAYGAQDIGIIGERFSVLDGRNCFDAEGEERYRGPHAIRFTCCTNVTLRGYTVRDSANWAHALFKCTQVTAQNLRVFAGHDGFDVHCCTDVLLADCQFNSGDDAIAGFGNVRVTVRDCLLSCACNDVRFGGTDCLFERCQSIQPAAFGHRAGLSAEEKRLAITRGEKLRHKGHDSFLYYCDYRWGEIPRPGNITFRACRFDNPDVLFRINYNGRNQWCTCRPLSSITFENCEILGVQCLAEIYGGAEDPITFTMRNCRVTPAKGFEDKLLATSYNFKQIILENVVFEGYVQPTWEKRSAGDVRVTGGTPIHVTYRADPNDAILTLDEIANQVNTLPADATAFETWLAGHAQEGGAWQQAYAVWKGELPAAKVYELAETFRARYGYYYFRSGQMRADYAKGPASDVPAALFIYTLAQCSPFGARVALTDYLRAGKHTPAANAGIKAVVQRLRNQRQE